MELAEQLSNDVEVFMMAADTPIAIRIGSRVETFGLQTLSFNGKQGIVTSLRNSENRATVDFGGFGHKIIKTNNLKVLQLTQQKELSRITRVGVISKQQYHNETYLSEAVLLGPRDQKASIQACDTSVSGRSLNAVTLARIKFVSSDSKIHEGIIALDSMCSHDVFRTDVSVTCETQGPRLSAKVFGGKSELLGLDATFTILRENGERVEIRGSQCEAKQLPKGCIALFSKTTLQNLNVAMDFHLRTEEQLPLLRHRGVPKLAEEKKTTLVVNDTSNAAKQAGLAVILGNENEETCAEIFLAETKIREYLERKGATFGAKKPASWQDVTFADHRFTAAERKLFREAVYDRRQVFTDGVSLPKPLKGEPAVIELIPGAKPFCCPEERWTPSRRRYLTIWAQQVLESGLYEWAELSQWASRVHLAYKDGPRGKEREEFEIRPVGDFPAINDKMAKMASNLPILRAEVEKYSKCEWFFECDGAEAYHQVPLDEKSRDICTIRTPIGKIRPTRLPEGLKNAGTILQSFMTRALNTLDPKVRDSVSNYADDINGGTETKSELHHMVISILDMCIANSITLKPSKTRIGFESANFGGFEVGRGARKLSEKHMDPLLNMTVPKNISDLRRVLGVFVQQKSFIRNYSVIARPLTRLTGTTPWRFGESELKAFEHLKSECCKRHTLANPDFSRRLFLDPDASQDGHGFVLYHELTENGVESKDAIMYGSRSWESSMVHQPTFYKEGYSLFWALDQCRYYIDASPFDTTVRTDHMPLKWIKHSTRGLLTPWMLEKCAGMTYTIEHLPGTSNLVADALSREPFVTRPMVTAGIDTLLGVLLDKIDYDLDVKNANTIWVWAEKDTLVASKIVQAWRNKSPLLDDGKILSQTITTCPKEDSYGKDWSLAIVATSGDRAASVCASLFKAGKPFACLVPSDLVSWVSLDNKLKSDTVLQRQMENAVKFTSLNTGLTWVVHGIQTKQQHVIFATVASGELVEHVIEEENNLEQSESEEDVGHEVDEKNQMLDYKEVGETLEWVDEQTGCEAQLRREASGEVLQLSNGLLVEVKEGETVKIIVPPRRRVALINHAHAATKHMGWKKILASLRKTYTWTAMSAQVKRVVTTCTKCADMRGRRNLAHGQFSSVIYDGPRRAYAFDFYSVAKSKVGYAWVLTVIDLFSREVMFIPTFTRTAEEVVRCLLQHLINVKGVPQVFMTDEAPEFVGKLVEGLCAALKIKHITTMGYDARRNAICERVHEFLGQCLTMLPKEEREHWERHLTEFSFAHDTATHDHLGQAFTPFEVGHGAEAKTIVSAPVAVPGEEDDATAIGYFGRVKQAALTFREMAQENLRTAHELQNKRLNDGSRKESYAVGDIVSIYFPTRSTDAEWKVKHMKKWRGPMRVIEIISGTTYRMQDEMTAQVFNRSTTNMKRYKAEVGGAVALGAEKNSEGAFMVGDMVAVRDSEESREFWLAEILAIEVDGIKCHYWATKNAVVKKAVFKPTFIGQTTGKTIIAYNNARAGEACEPWTGQVPFELVVCKIKLNDKKGARKLMPASQKALSGWIMARM